VRKSEEDETPGRSPLNAGSDLYSGQKNTIAEGKMFAFLGADKSTATFHGGIWQVWPGATIPGLLHAKV
jgi:hypothetical protein